MSEDEIMNTLKKVDGVDDVRERIKLRQRILAYLVQEQVRDLELI